MRIKVSVSQDNIDDGWSGCYSCPVALAIKGIDESYHPWVVSTRIMIYLNGSRVSIDTPRSVNRFVRRFDSRKPVKPFNFFLEIP